MKKFTVNDILPLLDGVKKTATGYTAKCPCHDDNNNSFSISEDASGAALVNCFVGCSQTDIWKYFNDKLGRPQDAHRTQKKRLVASYYYMNEYGDTIDIKNRYEPKGFSWQITTAKRKEQLPLYHLCEVLNSDLIFVCEGEKDADNLTQLGLCATNSKDGFIKENMHYLTDKHIRIIQDNDASGKKYAKNAALLCFEYAADVKILDLAKALPTLPQKGDISDALEQGFTKNDLLTFSQFAPFFEPDAVSSDNTAHPHAAIYKKIDGYYINAVNMLMHESGDKTTPVLYGSMIISEVITKYNGIEKEIFFAIDAIDQKGNKLSRCIVSANDFDSLNWIRKYYGADIVLTSQNTAKNKLITGLALTANSAPRRTIYAHTGYLTENNTPYAYTHANGAIGRQNGIQCALPDALKNYVFPDAHSATEKDAAENSLLLLSAHQETATFPLFAFIYAPCILPLLSDIVGDIGLCLYLQGKTQSGKSTIASLAMSHFGRFDAMTPPTTFNSTANYINELAFYLKDSILWIDDFHPQGTKKDADKQNAIFQSIARASGDHAFRGRLLATNKIAINHAPRCLFLATGEDAPQIGQSGIARLFTIQLDRCRNDITSIRSAAQSGILRDAMSYYIEYLLSNWSALQGQISGIYKNATELANKHFNTSRLSGQTSILLVSAYIYCEYLTRQGIRTQSDAKQLFDTFISNIIKSGDSIENAINENDPIKMYMRALSALITTGQRYTIRLDNTEYKTSDNLGAQGDCIGWNDATFYYLDSNATYKAIAAYYQGENAFFNISKNTINRELLKNGYIVGDASGATTVVKNINYKTVRVMRFKREFIDLKGSDAI